MGSGRLPAMSYAIHISGHSNEPHNDEIKKITDEAVKKLRKLPGASVTLSGYSNDETGHITLELPEDAK